MAGPGVAPDGRGLCDPNGRWPTRDDSLQSEGCWTWFAEILSNNLQLLKLQVPVSNRADQPYESRLGACPPALTRAGFEPASLA